MNKQTIIFTGISGCGKGTQAKLLQDFLKENTDSDVLYIETGSRFREFIKGDSYTSGMCREALNKGLLLPEYLAVWNWSQMLIEQFDGEQHIMLDGAPRRLLESHMLHDAFKFYDRLKTKPVIFYLELDDDEARNRLRGRAREDDGEEQIEERLSWFKEDMMPAIDYFRDNDDFHFVTLNGADTVDSIHQTVVEHIHDSL